MNYTELKTAILGWLARPGDPLLVFSTPGFITLFETEARRRLKHASAEALASLPAVGGLVALPSNMTELRAATISGLPLEYMPPDRLPKQGGQSWCYTILGNTLVLGPRNDVTVNLLYQAGIPPLSDAAPTNWLITQAPDAYLFGSLCEAEAYIGHDERIPLWEQRREAAFTGLELADRKYRWGGPLQIRVDGISVARPGAPGPAASQPVIVEDVAVRTINPLSGTIVTMTAGERAIFVDGGPRAGLTIWLPPDPSLDMLVEISFWRPVTTLIVADSAGSPIEEGPIEAYGPGAGLQLRYIAGNPPDPPGWILWK